MAAIAGSRPRVGPKAWIAISIVPVLLTVALYRFGVIGTEALGYLMPVCALATVPLALLHWRGIDELSREGHKFAIFWGMGFGVVIAVLVAAELMLLPGAQQVVATWIDGFIADSKGRLGDRPGAAGFYLGVLACGFLSIAGYVLVWLGWWAFQRVGTKSD